PLVLAADLALASVAADSRTRITLVDGNGRMRAWQGGRPTSVGDQAVRLYRAALEKDTDPAVERAVARLRVAGVPVALVVEPGAGSRASGGAAFLWSALALAVVAALAMAWLRSRVRGPARRGPPSLLGSTREGDEGDDDGGALDDSV